MADAHRILPEFVETSGGCLFVIRHEPAKTDTLGHAIVFVPPFAEEMNRCRRMVALQARSLADRGFSAVIFDLFGTGDSEGDFADATWDQWKENLRIIVQRCRDRGSDQISFVAIRTGALLLSDSDPSVVDIASRIVLWQPCLSGRQYLRQFLRLKLVAGIGNEPLGGGSIDQLVEKLRSGQSLEIAGYELARDLAIPMEKSSMRLPAGHSSTKVDWFELAPNEQVGLTPTSRKFLESANGKGTLVNTHVLSGPRFWDTVEAVVLPELTELTMHQFLEPV